MPGFYNHRHNSKRRPPERETERKWERKREKKEIVRVGSGVGGGWNGTSKCTGQFGLNSLGQTSGKFCLAKFSLPKLLVLAKVWFGQSLFLPNLLLASWPQHTTHTHTTQFGHFLSLANFSSSAKFGPQPIGRSRVPSSRRPIHAALVCVGSARGPQRSAGQVVGRNEGVCIPRRRQRGHTFLKGCWTSTRFWKKRFGN